MQSAEESCYKYLLTHPPTSLLNLSHWDSPNTFPWIPGSQMQWIRARCFHNWASTPGNIFGKHTKVWVCIIKAHWDQARSEQLSITNCCKTVMLPGSLPHLIFLLISSLLACCWIFKASAARGCKWTATAPYNPSLWGWWYSNSLSPKWGQR